MTFEETTQFLYSQVPVFQHSGANAYKPGLANTSQLDEYFKHPHKKYKTIHVGGTNGKGSVSHTLAAILQQSGYKVGLYTSPHLVDFRERIRVNGQMIDQQYVIDFVANHFENVKHIQPSFFELTMMMAFKYFEQSEVDVAIIEVGLGGRLDSTNIITPELSVITNISFDHIQFLGDTLEKIAHEKAGIIKPGIPVVIGEAEGNVRDVFADTAGRVNAPIVFSQQTDIIKSVEELPNGHLLYENSDYPNLEGELAGDCQRKNTLTLLNAIRILKTRGFDISEKAVRDGFANVAELTGLQGRWQKVADKPLTICDTGHNKAGIEYIVRQLDRINYDKLRIVIGMVNDKDVTSVVAMLPTEAEYYFTRASVSRSLPEDEFAAIAYRHNLKGKHYPTVSEAYEAARSESGDHDLIFIGGSNFIVADFLTALK